MNLPLNIDLQQVLLHMFNFLILAGGLYFLLYTPVKKFMDDRAAYYEKTDSEANSRLEEAEELRRKAEERLGDIDSEIAGKKAAVQQELEKLRADAARDAQKERARLIEEARLSARQEKDLILKQEHEEIVEILVAAAEKMVRNGESTDE